MTDDTSPPPSNGDKMAPEALDLHAKPRPVTRLNRKVLIGLSGTGLMLIFGATLYALKPPTLGKPREQELYNVNNNETPEQLTSLPKSYKDYKPPVLGAPLPGELGGAVLDAERRVGLDPLPFQTDDLTDAERAERIRLAQRAQQGRESAVFFQLSQRVALSRIGVDSLPSADMQSSNPSAAGEDNQSNLPLEPDQDPNYQGRKLDFLNDGPSSSVYNPFHLQTPASPYQVLAGTVIAASLITGLNSDLTGQVIAQVTQPVYDTVTGRHLLIPQGSRLLGVYDSVVAFGQERALVVWQRLILPDGASVVIDNLPATDRAGYAGLEDEVDFHTWRIVKGITLSTLFSVGSELAFNDDGNLVRALQRGTQNSVNRAGERLVERNINVQPTLKIRPGYPLRVIVNKDIVLRPYTEDGVQ